MWMWNILNIHQIVNSKPVLFWNSGTQALMHYNIKMNEYRFFSNSFGI